MPFSTTGSVISTDLDNMVRGLNRDNSDTVLTGTLVETTLKSFSVNGNTIGPTGCLHVIVSGAAHTGVAGTKTMRLKFGGTTIDAIPDVAATTRGWHFDVWIFNTATNAQRILIRRSNDAAASTLTVVSSYLATAVDTTATQTLQVTGQLGNVGDTITATMWDVFVAQIT